MKTEIVEGQGVRTIIDQSERVALVRLLHRLGSYAGVSALGIYQELPNDELWWCLVQQVCVAGSARGMEALHRDVGKVADLKARTSLKAWRKRKLDEEYMSICLRQSGATRFHRRAASRLAEMARTATVVEGTRVVLLDHLPKTTESETIREELLRRCPSLRRKSISDFMISVGVSHDVIALDRRVVGVLQRYFGFNLAFERVQASKDIYRSVEAALREVCRRADSSLGILDRTLFQFEAMTVIEFVMKYAHDEK
jgi:thermostable 8-oxoguanine DNA glycosylase